MQKETITTKTIQLVKQVYDIATELERLTGRPFTPDGHMVGSAGEVLAAYIYDLELLPPSENAHDARKGKVLVQVKTTGGNKQVGIRHEPEHLLVLQLERGSPKEVYNGPGSLAWSNAGPPQTNGQRMISLSRLRTLTSEVPDSKKLKAERSLE